MADLGLKGLTSNFDSDDDICQNSDPQDKTGTGGQGGLLCSDLHA